MSSTEPRSGSPLTSSVEKLRSELDRWLDVAWHQGERALDAMGIRGPAGRFVPDADVVETNDEVLITFDLPGVDPESVDVTLCGNMLTVKGRRTLAVYPESSTSHLRERATGEFSRSLAMPVSVNPEKVDASFQDGLLVVRLAKEPSTQARQIPVHRAGPPGPEAI